MKKIILTPMLVLGALSAHAAFALTPAPRYERAVLTSLNIDRNLPHLSKMNEGDLEVDYRQQEVVLHLYQNLCPPSDRACPEIVQPREEIRLPLTEVSTNECGVRIFKAERDSRPADGELQTLIVEDNSNNSCPTYVALPPTGIVYTTEIHGRGRPFILTTTSTFTADRMRIQR